MAALSDVPVIRKENLLVRAATAFWNGLVALGESAARTKELEFFANLTDEELEKRGLTRDQIVRHVYRDRISL